MQSSDEVLYKLLHLLESRPNISQRKMAIHLSISLGRLNACLSSLVDEGAVSVKKTSMSNKVVFHYQVTAHGLNTKVKMGRSLLKRREADIETLRCEIEGLRAELNTMEDQLK